MNHTLSALAQDTGVSVRFGSRAVDLTSADLRSRCCRLPLWRGLAIQDNSR